MSMVRRSLRWAFGVVSAFAVALPGWAQVTATAGFGTGGSITTTGMAGAQTITIPANVGQQRGGNLFHSFTEFDVGAGDTAKFTDTGLTTPMTINNIIARIYSANPSMINGNVVVDTSGHLATANLFLINPNGVVFGANSSVSVPGDFVVSTANYTVLSDGTGVFYSDPTNASSKADNLTSAPVSAFGFFQGTTPAGITVNGGANLMVGGSLQFATGSFAATGGANLTVSNSVLGIFSGGQTSATADGSVPYLNGTTPNYSIAANFASYGNVTLGSATTGATLSATGTGGAVVIRGGRLVQMGSGASLSASKQVSIQADSVALSGTISTGTGTIGIDTTGDITMTGGTITAQGGSIALGSSSLVNLTLDSASAITETAGTGGLLSINASGTIMNGGTISTVGSADPLHLNAAMLSLTSANNVSGSITASGGALALGTMVDPLGGLSLAAGTMIGETGGAGAMLTINTSGAITSAGTISTVGNNSLQISAASLGLSGTISTVSGTLGVNTTGSVTLTGGTITSQGGSIALGQTSLGSLSLDDMSSIAQTGGTNSMLTIDSTGAVMDGGTISTVGTNSLQISAASLGVSGTVSTVSGPLTLNTTGAATLTGGTITSQGGSITLGQTSLGSLSLDGMSSITETAGSSGMLTIDSTGAIMSSGTISTAGSSEALHVTAQSVALSGTISTGSGPLSIDTMNDTTLTGGTIMAQGGSITLGQTNLANLSLDSTSIINSVGGMVTVTSRGDIDLSGGSIISSTTGGSNAGNVNITDTSGNITLDSGAQIASIATSTASGNAGNVTINGGVTATNSAKTLTITGTGVAGPNSGIFSLSNGTGSAGSVNVVALGNVTLSAGGQIASVATNLNGGNAGTVTLSMNADPSTLTIGGISANATTVVPIIYSSTANAAQSDGAVNLYTLLADVELQSGAAIQTSAQDTTAGNIIVEASSLTLDPYSAIQSVMSQVSKSDTSTSGATGNVLVIVLNPRVYPFTGPLSIADNAFIQTVANPNKKTFNPLGQVTVFAGSLTEGGMSVPTAADGYDFSYVIAGHTQIRMQNATSVDSPNGSDASNNAKPIVENLFGYPNTSNGMTLPTPPPGDGIVLDGTLDSALGNTVVSVAPTLSGLTYVYTITSSDGTVAGNNLFLSFQDFTLGINHPDSSDPSKVGPVSEEAIFDAPGLSNIIARVTGGTASQINGELAEASGTTANLFLLNSSGIMFTTNSSLNLQGALTVSSADSIQIGGVGTFLSQPNTLSDMLLTTAPSLFTGPVTGFGFTATMPAAITFDTATLSNDASTNSQIQVIAGDITLDGGSILNASQTLLFSAGGPGTLTFPSAGGSLSTFSPAFTSASQVLDDSSFSALGTVTLSNDSVLTVPSPNIASTILIRANAFNLDDSLIVDQTTADTGSLGGKVLIDLTGAASITSANNSSTISTSTLGASDAGNVQINAASLTITGDPNDVFTAGILSTAQPANYYTSDSGFLPFTYATPSTATGNAGSVTLDISGAITLSSFGEISTNSNGLGTAGTITISGLNGVNPQLSISGGSSITSSTSLDNPAFTQTGNAGTVLATLSSFSITGFPSTISTSAGTPTNTAGPTGDGGNINLTVTGQTDAGNGDITISNGAFISASSFNNGKGGTVVFNQTNSTDGIVINGEGSSATTGIGTGIFAAEYGDGSSSAVGLTPAINIITDSPIMLTGGGEISTSAAGNGSAGPVRVVSGNLTIDGTGAAAAQTTGILSSSTGSVHTGTNPDATGNGGDITLDVTGDLSVTNGGAISASSDTVGAAGTVTINQSGSTAILDPATNPTVNGGIYLNDGSISTAADGIGAANSTSQNAGDITLNTQALTLDDGTIISSTFGLSKGGNITVNGVTSGRATQFVVLKNGSEIASNTGGTGDGGTISILTGALTVDGANSAVSTNATAGSGGGGSIGLTVTGDAAVLGAMGDVVLTNGGAISASSETTGEAGTVTITQSGSTDLVDPATNPSQNGGVYINGGSITTAANGVGTQTPMNMSAGDISLRTQALTLEGGGDIVSSTFGLSTAGNITVNGVTSGQPTRFVIVSGNSAIVSGTGGTGDGGTISINSGALTVDGADSLISTIALSGTGGGGSIGIMVTGNASVVGATGDVALTNGGAISSASYSTGEAGTVTIAQSGSTNLVDPATNPATNGGLYINGGSITTAANGVGTASPMNVDAGNISLSTQALTLVGGGQIVSSTFGLSKAGDITVNGVTTAQPTQFVIMKGGSTIASNTGGAGDGGAISILTGALTVDGANSAISTSATAGTGGGGSIALTVTGNAASAGSTGDVALTNGGAISASSDTSGEAGTVTISQSGSTDLATDPTGDGGLYLDDGLITTAANGIGTASPTNTSAGDITLNVQAVTLTGGSLILSSTSGASKAGDVTIGGAVTGTDTQFVIMEEGAQIASETGGANGSGSGGTITIATGSLALNDAGISTSTTSGVGRAGDISISTVPSGATEAGSVTLQNGGTIMSESADSGSAGMIAIATGMLTVSDTGSSISTDAGTVGQAGNSKGEIVLSGADFTIENDGLISATTGGLSPGGTITITASNAVTLSLGGELDASSTSGTNGGNGGSIQIGADPLGPLPDFGVTSPLTVSLSGHSAISCDSENTNGGNISITTQQLVSEQSVISTNEPNGAANTLGGDITIQAQKLFYLDNYSFVDSDAGKGTGGNIFIDPEFTVLNHSGISAAGGTANGNVTIDSTYVLAGTSFIVATGTVDINSVPLDLTGSLLPLPADLTDEEKRLREKCARAVNHEFSSFIVVGRGGTESAPEELQPDFGL